MLQIYVLSKPRNSFSDTKRNNEDANGTLRLRAGQTQYDVFSMTLWIRGVFFSLAICLLSLYFAFSQDHVGTGDNYTCRWDLA